MPFTTVAVPIIAHHVPYVNLTSAPSTFHVPLIHGYCVLYELHDIGWVIVDDGIGEKYAVKFLLPDQTQSILLNQVNQSLHHENV
jgi:hypothetical protein